MGKEAGPKVLGGMDASQWVLTRTNELSRYLGAPIKVFDVQSKALFVVTKERWRNSMEDRNMRHTVNPIAKGARELQNPLQQLTIRKDDPGGIGEG